MKVARVKEDRIESEDEFDSLATLKSLFGVKGKAQEENLPVLVQAGMECMTGDSGTPEGVESSVIDALDTVESNYDAIAVALVSMAAVVAVVEMPPASRAAIDNIIHLNISKLEKRLS